MQSAAPVKSVPVNYSMLWLKCSVRIAEKNYALFLKVGLFTVLTSIAVALVPFIGIAVSPVLSFIYTLATLRFMKLIVDRQPINFEGFLNIAFDQDILKRFRPYLITVFVCGVIEVILSQVHLKFLVLPFSLIAGIITLACGLAAYTEMKMDTNNPKETLRYIAKGLFANILPLLAVSVLAALAAGVAIVLCFVPLFVVFVPMVVPVRFLVYSAIFEFRDIQETMNEWHKPETATVSASIPPEVPTV